MEQIDLDRANSSPILDPSCRLNDGRRIVVLIAMFIAAVTGLYFADPVPQDAAYHLFADTRSWLGIANFGDTVSNLAFLMVGGFGLVFVLRPRSRNLFDHPSDALPYAIFFAGVASVSVGSAYYHLAPDNSRLFWDRMPMTVAFMALFSAFIADRVHRRAGIFWLLPILLVAGFTSVVYWDWSESLGRGDLRFYILVQFYPMVALPVVCWLFPKSRYTDGGCLAWLIGGYGAAKALEYFDAEVLDLLGGAVSGHTLKHVTAAFTVLAIWRMLALERIEAR